MTEMQKCLINGECRESVDVTDRGFAYGDGLFETLLLINGKIPFIDDHLDRLMAGVEKFQINGIDAEKIKNDVCDFASQIDVEEGVLKLTITRGAGGRGYLPANNLSPTIILQSFPKKSNSYKSELETTALGISSHCLPLNDYLAGLKHLSAIDYVIASLDWTDSIYNDGIILDVEDDVIETSSKNIFLVTDNTMYTPVLNRCGVSGVFRKQVFNTYANQIGMDVVERRLKLSDFRSATEVFVANSVAGVQGVSEISGIAAYSTFDVAEKIRQSWQMDIQNRLC